jgi:hypothetical protein
MDKVRNFQNPKMERIGRARAFKHIQSYKQHIVFFLTSFKGHSS